MRAIEYILLLSVLMLGMLLLWPVVTGLVMAPLEPLMDHGIWSYLTLIIPFALSVLTLELMLKKGLGTSMRRLMWEDGERRTERMTAATVFIVLLLLFIATSFLSPTMVKSGFPGLLTFLSLVISLVFIPLQCLAEELMFRVIPARMFFPEGFGKNRTADALFILGSGAFFALLHSGNPEVKEAELKWVIMLNYFLSGASLSLFAVMTKGFLTGLAFHTAVNLYVSVFVNMEKGVIPSYSFFMETAEKYEVTSLISTLIASGVTVLIILLIKNKGKRYGR